MEDRFRKTTLYLSDELHARAKSAAAQLRIPLTALVARAIQHELERIAAESISERPTQAS